MCNLVYTTVGWQIGPDQLFCTLSQHSRSCKGLKLKREQQSPQSGCESDTTDCGHNKKKIH